MTSRRSAFLPLAAVVAVLALAGCSNPAPAPTTAAPTTPATSPTPTPTGSADPVDPDAPAGQCADSAISVAVAEGDAGAGNLYYQVVFTNTGTTACELRGYPGVSVVGDGNGTQIGAAAAELQGGPEVATYTVEPGGTIGASLTAVNVAGGGGPLGDACQATTGDGWRVYPPHSFEAVFVEAPGVAACANAATPWLTIAPLSAE
ncbi:DUF4232 domain-containing protein [Amnibacterium flavum]|uniref:DUF4232 domain-containing protein n=1 Tax=Amnibacterium flavum TaxID=2173173 RepID=A0A2V1HTD0_9MICO|nr:DUF4232 domain-containing protein [Amnibacterium flavum]PVZ95823.1 DUF4232 domain-containing protein [Amnibacterium flavum]